MTTKSGSIGKIAYDSYSGKGKRIQGTVKDEKILAELKTVLQVNQGDVVKASTRFATRGAYYVGISERTGKAATLTNAGTVFDGNSGWSSFYWSVLFQANSTTELEFSIRLGKGDLPGNYLIYNPSLTAEIVASDPLSASNT